MQIFTTIKCFKFFISSRSIQYIEQNIYWRTNIWIYLFHRFHSASLLLYILYSFPPCQKITIKKNFTYQIGFGRYGIDISHQRVYHRFNTQATWSWWRQSFIDTSLMKLLKNKIQKNYNPYYTKMILLIQTTTANIWNYKLIFFSNKWQLRNVNSNFSFQT